MSLASEAPVKSPCTSVCRMNEPTGWCEGCMRTLDEIARWSTFDNAAKRRVCAALALRREQMTAQEPNPR